MDNITTDFSYPAQLYENRKSIGLLFSRLGNMKWDKTACFSEKSKNKHYKKFPPGRFPGRENDAQKEIIR